MPTIKTFGSLSLRIYADDHNPPHFHLVSAEIQVLVRIDDLSILAGQARPGVLAEALDWAAENKVFLLDTWTALNART